MFSFRTTSAAQTTSSEGEATPTPAAPPTTTAAHSTKMPQTGSSLVTPATISYEFVQAHQQSHFTATTSTTGNDPYETYTDNFDLSLLPQDCNNLLAKPATITTNIIETNHTSNIPTTVYNFDTTTQKQQHPFLQQDKVSSLAVPDIKIEHTWSSCPSLNTIKQEQIYGSYFPLKTKQNQLIPPPAYPGHIYPSPQSSPAQSEYNFPRTQCTSSPLSSTCYESLSSSRNSLYNAVSSPCPSIDVQTIKQEQLHILPPSPPESSCDTPTPQSSYSNCSSGFDFKSEPFESDVETSNDFKKTQNCAPTEAVDHQLLREYLEDTTFQKLHNLKPLALESFIGDLDEVRDNFEPVISLALEHAKREADATCAKLQISQDPSVWSTNQVHAWLRSTLQQYKLPIATDIENRFTENGAELLQLMEEDFINRIPECGSTLHAQLEIWKLTYSPDFSKNTNQNQIPLSQNIWNNNIGHAYSNGMEEDNEDKDDFLTNSNTITNTIQRPTIPPANGQFVNNDEMINTNSNCINNIDNHTSNHNNTEVTNITPVKRTATRNGGSHIHLWQFLKELLAAPHINGTAIRWIDRSKGIFKIEDSVRVAKLWGKRKNRPAMNYDKLSRSIRQYYKKGIMKKTERSQRLVYQFCQPYHM